MTLRKGVYHWENQKIHIECQQLFEANQSSPCIVTLGVRPHVPIAFVAGGHIKMCNYGDIGQKIHGKSSLKIIST